MNRPGGAARWAASFVAHAALMVGAVAAAGVVDHPAWWLAMAAVFAFASVQVGYLAHDLDHGQATHRRTWRRGLGLLAWNLLLGIPHAWWRDKHIRHHRHTHIPGEDPDLYALFGHDGRPPSAYHPLHRWLLARQHWLFWPVTGFARLYFQAVGFVAAARRRDGRATELGLLVLHHGLLWFAAWQVLGVAAIGFVLVGNYLTGLYMGLAFATNHLGRPTARATGPGRLWQAAHTRNIRAGRVGDYLLGGLNRQIEHHVHPSADRARLRALAADTRRRCEALGIAYHETGLREALAEVQAALRHNARAMAAP